MVSWEAEWKGEYIEEGKGGWEREVGIGGGRGVFWNFFFFEKRGLYG